MRESPGYAPVPSAAASVAFSASPARCRRHFGRRRRKSSDDDVGIISGYPPHTLTNPLGH